MHNTRSSLAPSHAMLPGLDAIIEERILKAQAEGAFDHLPGAGKPLELDDDLLVPYEARIANRILKNAGVVPPEIDQVRELQGLVQAACEGDEHDPAARAAARKLRLLAVRLEHAGFRVTASSALAQYRQALMSRFEGRERSDPNLDLRHEP